MGLARETRGEAATSHDTVGVWHHLEDDSRSSSLRCQNTVIPGCRGFLQHVNDGAGGTTTLATCYRLDIVLESLGEFRMLLIRYVSRMFKQRGHKLADMEKQRRLHEQTTQGRLQLDLET